MKDQRSMLVKGFIAALVMACFTVTVQAAPAFQEPQQKTGKMSDSKMSDKKKDKMSHDKMSGRKMHKMSDGKMGTKKMDKMSKDTTGKM